MVKVNKKQTKHQKAKIAGKTRKELRKLKTAAKKENKRLFFSSKGYSNYSKENKKIFKVTNDKSYINSAKLPSEQLMSSDVESDNSESNNSYFSNREVTAILPVSMKSKNSKNLATAVKKAKQRTPNRPNVMEQHRRELQRQKDLENASQKHRIKQLKVENEEENKVIAKLEKKLGLNKTKNKNGLVRKMFNDGLDFALELCLDEEEEKEKQYQKQKRKHELKEQQKDTIWSEEQDEQRFNEIFGSGSESGDLEEDDNETYAGDDTAEEIDKSANDLGEDGEAIQEFKEDIYGRKRDKDGNVMRDSQEGQQKYIPPHQRPLLATNGEKQSAILERLRKQCKGLLNRLSESNLHKICTGIEELYMKNSRFNMNETLNLLMQEALITKIITNERMVQEHMVLLSYLHAHIGSEIGAHFLQIFVEQFDTLLVDLENLQQEDKRLNNVVLLLSYMYLFKIFENRLLLEIIDRLSSHLGEKTIECLLLLFQSVGFKLRKDDPLSFKQMILNVQNKISSAPLEMKENLRLKYMVDILNAVKNNNINKIPCTDQEIHERLRKKLKAMLRNEKYVVSLNVTMEDLLRADTVGKWWVVGSAWTGNINEMGAAHIANEKECAGISKSQRYSEQLLKLAKQQKMNTEERRNIFCIIMSATDYINAFEKILHLAVKDQRSVAYVIIHCCLNEKLSNPYYAHLALRFCNYNRKYQLAFQYAAWDRINDIDSLNKIQVRNFARFLQQLILYNGLQLAVLKVVDFIQLDKQSFAFMKEICKGLLLAPIEQDVYLAFERMTKNHKLEQFKQNLRLFLQHFLLKEQRATLNLSNEEKEVLHRRIEYVDKLLAYVGL